MQRTMKRIGALVLALAMLVTFMPMLGLENAHAEAAEPIEVFITVLDRDVIAAAEDGSAMAWKKVTVEDLDKDGKFTYDEALVAAHDAYFPGGAEEGYKAKESGMVEMFWGVANGGSYSFMRNSEPTDVVTVAEIQEYDYLSASVNQDEEFYSDWATSFDAKNVLVDAEEEFDLTLTGFGAMTTDEPAPIEGAQLAIWEDGELVPIEDAVTDEDGTASLSFDEPGTYVVSAIGEDVKTELDLEPSYGLIPSSKDKDDRTIYGKMDWSSPDMDSYIGYTEENYEDGPYPKDEIQWIPFEDFDAETFDEGYLLYSGVISGCPIIPPCCIVRVPHDPIDVYVTVNNKGVLAKDAEGEPMVEAYVTAYDLDADGEITVDEALQAAHEQYCEVGADGYATEEGYYGPAVTKLWGVDTKWNSLFFINGNPISAGVTMSTIEDSDSLYASVNADDVYYSDFYSEFDEYYPSGVRNEKVKLKLEGFPGMAYTPEELEKKPLAGIQLGLWNAEDGFTPIEGAVTDENGIAKVSFPEEGRYLITAKGTVKQTVTDYSDPSGPKEVEADCPIMAPFCFLDIEENEDGEAALPAKEAIDDLPEVKDLTLEDKEAVKNALELYNKLTEDQTDYISYAQELKLFTADATIDKLEAEKAAKDAQDALADAKQMLNSALGNEVPEEDLEKLITQVANAKTDLETAAGKLADIQTKLNEALGNETPESDVDRLLAQVTNAKKDLKDAQDALDTVKEKLNKALGNNTSGEDLDKLIEQITTAAKGSKDSEDKLKAANQKIAELTVKAQKVNKVKAKGKKKKAKVSWKSLGKGYKYEVFKAKKINGKYKKAATTSKVKVTLKKLKSKKTIFVKVRAFKMVNGKKVYTQFSDVVSVKAK